MASIVLVQSTQGNIDLTGDPARADGWYGYPDSLYTVAISTTNFVGRVYIEASLALVPTDADWFSIELRPSFQFLDYPLIPSAPTGFNGGDTGVRGYTFRGNFLYLRARITRSYLYGNLLTSDEIALLGDARIILSQSQTTYSTSSTLPPIVGFTQLMNIGVGYQTYAGLNDLSIPTFRALAPGAGISMVQTANAITISATGSGGNGILSTQGSFLQLTDTPNNYIDYANAVVRVNSSGNGLVFVASPAVAVSGLINDASGILTVAKGGTGLGIYSTNTILYAGGPNAIATIAAPTVAGTVLTWNGTQFIWKNSITSSRLQLAWPPGTTVANGNAYFCFDTPYAGTINSLKYFSQVGSFTTSVMIDGVGVSGLSGISVTESTSLGTGSVANATASGLNTFTAGQRIVAEISDAISSPTDALLSLSITWIP